MEGSGPWQGCRSAPGRQSVRTPARRASSQSLPIRSLLRLQGRESARGRHRSSVPVGWKTRPGFLGRTSAVLGAGPAQSMSCGDECGLGAIIRLQLAEDRTDVVADGLLCQAKVLGDLPVAQAAGQQIEHFGFTACEFGKELSLTAGHGVDA